MYYGKRKSFRKVAVTTPRKGKYTPRKSYRKKMPMVSFTKRVNKIISANIENKCTNTISYVSPIAAVTAGTPNTYSFATWSPGGNTSNGRLFNMGPLQGAGYGQGRIGNTIKLKRWIIKGIIEPDYLTPVSDRMLSSYVGYVDIYFGRLIDQLTPVTSALPRLYQTGATAVDPSCKSNDILNKMNKDEYKVYYHRRFKMGANSDASSYDPSAPAQLNPANNDFKLSQTFGFDVCKHVMKNRHIKYPLTINTTPPFDAPTDNDVLNLTLWATFTPWTGQGLPNGSTPTSQSLYAINCLSYAEYEDA